MYCKEKGLIFEYIAPYADKGVLCFSWLVVSEYKTTSKQMRKLLGSQTKQ